MSYSPYLRIVQLSENVANAYTMINEAVTALEGSQNQELNVTTAMLSAGLTHDEAYRNYVFDMPTLSSSADLKFPKDVDTPVLADTPTANRVFVVRNTSTQTVTVKSATGSGATVAVLPATNALIYQTAGVNFYALLSGSSSGSSSSNVVTPAVFVPGAVPASTEILRWIVTESTSFPDNFANSRGSIAINPTSSMTFDIKRNGTTIGTIAISTGGVFTFLTSGSSTEVFAAGDILTIVSPGADATAANLSITLKGTR